MLERSQAWQHGYFKSSHIWGRLEEGINVAHMVMQASKTFIYLSVSASFYYLQLPLHASCWFTINDVDENVEFIKI